MKLNIHKYRGLFFKTILFLAVFSTLLVFTGTVFSGRQGDTAKHCLWSIETENNTIFMLGSLHISPAEIYPLPEIIERAYDQCAKVIFEADMEAVNDPSFQTRIMTLGVYPQGDKLENNVSAQTFNALKKRADATGIPIQQLNRLKPWLCALSITSIELLKLGFNPAYGIDMYFFNRAKKDGKEILGFETAEFQLKLMTQMTGRQEEMMLRQTLKDLEVIEKDAASLVTYWKNGDANKLDSFITRNLKEFPQLYDRWFTSRNHRWLSEIKKLTGEKENIFIIVGAGHLVGRDGLVELLRKQNYKIRQR
ncbi:MAG: TraB/GumN family protein [Thermodesulfobacteriota bacterium]|nr:TraB/GumN family protein [Thermodesulfobacteriota bacterium]